MARSLAIVNQKGGVGKTTTAVNLAASLAAAEQRVLLVDLDPQGNASHGLGLERNAPGLYEILTGGPGTEASIRVGAVAGLPRLDVLVSSSDLYGADIELANQPGRELLLRTALAPVLDRYQFVLIDCPPSLGLLTLNALVAAEGVLVPLQSEYYALEGLSQVLRTIDHVKESFNPGLHLAGVLLTMCDPRNNLAREVEKEARNHLGEKVFTTTIPRNVRLSESPSFGKPIIIYDIESKGAQAYLALADEILGTRRSARRAAGR